MPNKQEYAKLKEEGRCTRCHCVNDSKGNRCLSCVAKMKEWCRERRLKYQSEGKCPRCGRPADNGDNVTQCANCTMRRFTFLFHKYPNEEFR